MLHTRLPRDRDEERRGSKSWKQGEGGRVVWWRSSVRKFLMCFGGLCLLSHLLLLACCLHHPLPTLLSLSSSHSLLSHPLLALSSTFHTTSRTLISSTATQSWSSSNTHKHTIAYFFLGSGHTRPSFHTLSLRPTTSPPHPPFPTQHPQLPTSTLPPPIPTPPLLPLSHSRFTRPPPPSNPLSPNSIILIQKHNLHSLFSRNNTTTRSCWALLV